MNQVKLPSERLAQRRPIRTALIAVAATALVAASIGTAATLHERAANTAPAPRVHITAGLLTHDEITQVADIAQDSQDAANDEQKREDDAAAALAAQQAEAAAAAAPRQSSSGWAPGEAPAGTRIPTHLDTDPNSGSYGQQIIDDPGFFCASHSGNDVGGVQVCA